MKEARYYLKKENSVVHCMLCPHHCVLSPGKVGLCQVRRNEGGVLYSLNYGRVSSDHLDPIEKKPLYHFYPGSQILSLGTLGCNMSCSFCQNASISQIPRNEIDIYFNRMTGSITPAQVGDTASKFEKKGSIGIAYTYNEPSIWFEFVLDSAKEVKKRGLKNVLVTNGFLEKEPQLELMPYIDAVNVDIKSIRDSYYRKLCGARLEPVLEFCKRAKEASVLVELTNLVVTGENDSEDDLTALTEWIKKNLGADTPIHFSRYHPSFRFEAPPTPVETLVRAYEIASKELHYVYVGNIWKSEWDSTRCPGCHRIVIERSGYQLKAVNLKDGKCSFCGAAVAVVSDL